MGCASWPGSLAASGQAGSHRLPHGALAAPAGKWQEPLRSLCVAAFHKNPRDRHLGGCGLYLEALTLLFPMAPLSFMKGTYPSVSAHRPPDAPGVLGTDRERESVASRPGVSWGLQLATLFPIQS